MSSVFDNLRQGAWNVVGALMGEIATWAPAIGGPVQTCNVLKRTPTTKEKLGFAEYTGVVYFVEYQQGLFPGLAESVDGGTGERLTLDGVAYYVEKVERKFDGNTFRALLTPDN